MTDNTEFAEGTMSQEYTTARPVPHISIHAFCENEQTAASIYNVAQDRRMSKAHVLVEMGGIPAAQTWFAANPTPNLIIVESSQDANTMFQQLDYLAGVCDENTKVIVIGHMNDVHLYRQLIQKGVSEYIVAPVQPLQIMEGVSNLFTDPDSGPLGEVIAFVGAKGGVGSSVLCHNAAWSIAQNLNSDVVIADFDLPYGTAGLNFNQDPIQGVADAVFSPERVDDVLMERLLHKFTDHVNLFAAPCTLERTYDLNASSCDIVTSALRNNIPFILLDLPSMWTEWTKELILQADQVVIVAEPDLANLRNAKNLFEVVMSSRDNDTPPSLVLNKIGVPKRPEITVADFASALDVTPQMVLDFDAQMFGTAANNGQMIGELSPAHKASTSFKELAYFLAHKNKTTQEKKSVLGPILSRLNLKKAG